MVTGLRVRRRQRWAHALQRWLGRLTPAGRRRLRVAVAVRRGPDDGGTAGVREPRRPLPPHRPPAAAHIGDDAG